MSGGRTDGVGAVEGEAGGVLALAPLRLVVGVTHPLRGSQKQGLYINFTFRKSATHLLSDALDGVSMTKW